MIWRWAPGLVAVLCLAATTACIQAPVRVSAHLEPGADLSGVQSFAPVPPPWPHPVVGEQVRMLNL